MASDENTTQAIMQAATEGTNEAIIAVPATENHTENARTLITKGEQVSIEAAGNILLDSTT